MIFFFYFFCSRCVNNSRYSVARAGASNVSTRQRNAKSEVSFLIISELHRPEWEWLWMQLFIGETFGGGGGF